MPLLPALLAALAVSAPDAPVRPDPCAGLKAPLPASVAGEARRRIEAYRAAWRVACDPSAGVVNLAELFGEAEVLSSDVTLGPAVEAILRAAPADASPPLPGVRGADASAPISVDWGAFEAFAERGTAEDRRFWLAAARVVDGNGEPVWLGPPPAAGPRCVRLGEAPWSEIAAALEQMEGAEDEPYVRHTRALHAGLVAALAGIAGGRVCGCVAGDPLAGLEPLAASGERRGTPSRRSLARSAGEAARALREGRVRVEWLRGPPGAPAGGCRPGGP